MIKKDIILVDKNDIAIGESSKTETHEKGFLHRAFSIFILNKKNELLLQQRSFEKYHSPGLWTNTCCSHPQPGEITFDAAHRRLPEEMGFDCKLQEIFSFIYKAHFANNLIEHEFDHVFVGRYDGKICPNISEVNDNKWINLDFLKNDLEKNPAAYTAWLKICFDKFFDYMKNNNLSDTI